MSQTEKIEKQHILAMLGAALDGWKQDSKTGQFMLNVSFCDGGVTGIKIIQEETCKKIEILEKFSLQSKTIMLRTG